MSDRIIVLADSDGTFRIQDGGGVEQVKTKKELEKKLAKALKSLGKQQEEDDAE